MCEALSKRALNLDLKVAPLAVCLEAQSLSLVDQIMVRERQVWLVQRASKSTLKASPSASRSHRGKRLSGPIKRKVIPSLASNSSCRSPIALAGGGS